MDTANMYTAVSVAGVAPRFLTLPVISELNERLFNAAELLGLCVGLHESTEC